MHENIVKKNHETKHLHLLAYECDKHGAKKMATFRQFLRLRHEENTRKQKVLFTSTENRQKKTATHKHTTHTWQLHQSHATKDTVVFTAEQDVLVCVLMIVQRNTMSEATTALAASSSCLNRLA